MGQRPALYFAVGAAVFLIMYWYWYRWFEVTIEEGTPRKGAPEAPATEPVKRVKVEVYMESHCGDTLHFVKDTLYPVYRELSDLIDLQLVPFGKAKVKGAGAHAIIDCQHGPRECETTAFQSCAIVRYSQKEAFEIVACAQSKDINEVQECAPSPKSYEQMKACALGAEGKHLLIANGERTKELSPKMTFVPWLVVNGVRLEQMSKLRQTVCSEFEGHSTKCN